MNDFACNCSIISLSCLSISVFLLIVNEYMFIVENVEKTENYTMVFNTQIKIISNPTTQR